QPKMSRKYAIAASKVNDAFADEIDIYAVSAGVDRPTGMQFLRAVDKDRHRRPRPRLREKATYPESRAPAGSNARSLRHASKCGTGIVLAIFPVAPAWRHPK